MTCYSRLLFMARWPGPTVRCQKAKKVRHVFLKRKGVNEKGEQNRSLQIKRKYMCGKDNQILYNQEQNSKSKILKQPGAHMKGTSWPLNSTS